MDPVVLDKSFLFAVRVVKLSRHLRRDQREYVLSRQVLRSGTSIGANVEEARAGLSRKEFIAKIAIASKEARETAHWLRLLNETNYLDSKVFESIHHDCDELIRMLTSIVKTSREAT
ncbi:MAG: four helix bundle protein [Gammaproteobacteria bacterium]